MNQNTAACNPYDLNLFHSKNHKLWLTLWQDWTDETVPAPFPVDGWMPDHLNDVWEFRFDGGRQRYLARQWQPDSENPFYAEDWTPSGTLWTDYQGASPYVDYTASNAKSWVASEQTRYLPGMGTQADQTMGVGGATTYYHGDLIGSTMLLTDGVGQTVNTAAYTAFGEYIAPNNTIGGDLPADFSRYGYAGAHGYESGLMTLQGANTNLPPITLQHLGERWYQPSLGRFIQRDPIGVRSGVNVYVYCEANPLSWIDPTGLTSIIKGWIKGLVMGGAAAVGGAVGGGVGTLIGGPGAGTTVGGVIGGATCGYFAGVAFDAVTDPELWIEATWALENPPPPIRRKPICVRGCHRESVDYPPLEWPPLPRPRCPGMENKR